MANATFDLVFISDSLHLDRPDPLGAAHEFSRSVSVVAVTPRGDRMDGGGDLPG